MDPGRRKEDEKLGLAREAAWKIRAALENVLQGVSKLDADGNYTIVHTEDAKTLGYDPDELKGRRWLDTIHPSSHDEVADLYREMLESGRAEGEVKAIRKDGSLFWKHVILVKTQNEEGAHTGIYYFFTDITARKEAQQALQSMALTDEMTGLFNRRGFTLMIPGYLERARQAEIDVALVSIDLDGFKGINDRHGHAEGDSAIRAAAQILRESFRDTDVVARLGGDEFAVLTGEAGLREEGLRERLAANLAAFNARKTAPWTLAWSAGVIRTSPHAIEPVEGLLARADAAMYERKRLSKKAGP